nr:MAG TPA: hypothetical protein [Caudoviricetes sp.]
MCLLSKTGTISRLKKNILISAFTMYKTLKLRIYTKHTHTEAGQTCQCGEFRLELCE